MIEKHPFGNFVPKKVRYLMLGSFVSKPSNPSEWFYANGRNQFWPIMREVYGVEFRTTKQQQSLFVQLEMALVDIILSCERRILCRRVKYNLFVCRHLRLVMLL